MWQGGYGWHFWWMFPMMMLFFILVCGVIFLVVLQTQWSRSALLGAARDEPTLGRSKLFGAANFE